MKDDFRTLDSVLKKWILIGIPVIGIVGSFMHYIYEWTGNSIIAGLFTPVNESVWEHLKMSYWPMLIWWLAGYYIFRRKHKISAVQWFTAAASAQLISLLVILAFYYTYTGALGIESVILDTFSLFLGIAAAHCIALLLYKHVKLPRYFLFISITILVLLAAGFIAFTFIPPHIPLFLDSSEGKYGI